MNVEWLQIIGSVLGGLASCIPAMLLVHLHRKNDRIAKEREDFLHHQYVVGIIQSCLIRLSGVYTSLSDKPAVPYNEYLQAVNILAETNNLIGMSIDAVNQTKDTELLAHIMAMKSHIDQCLGIQRVADAADRDSIKRACEFFVTNIKDCEIVFKAQRIPLRIAE